MELTARNKLNGVVKEVKLGEVMAEITLRVEAGEVVAAVTRASAESMGLKPGDEACAIIKATEVIVGK